MRRGAPVAQQLPTRVVHADVDDDLEGGGGSATAAATLPANGPSSYLAAGSPSSFGNGSIRSDRPENGGSFHEMDVLVANDDSQKKSKSTRRRRHHHHHGGGGLFISKSYLTSHSPDALRVYAIGLLVGTVLLASLLPIVWSILAIVFGACAFGAIASLWLSWAVLQCDDGTAEMRAVSDPIREGAEGFLHVQYTAIAKFALPLAGLIVLSYQFRPVNDEPKGVAVLGNTTLGVVAALGFIFGAVCSALSGYVSMWVAAQSNIRVASASRRTYGEALVICFRGGAFSAVLNLTLCITGVAGLYAVLHVGFISSDGDIKPTDIPMLLVGYGFGASFVALFMQLGGGIYTKAADVGADLVGKVEQSIPEDDPRNPATIADLVGDMVGDCVGSSADVFESVAAEIIGAMILGSTLADETGMTHKNATKFVFFPLIVHAMDIFVSSAGIAFVGITR